MKETLFELTFPKCGCVFSISGEVKLVQPGLKQWDLTSDGLITVVCKHGIRAKFNPKDKVDNTVQLPKEVQERKDLEMIEKTVNDILLPPTPAVNPMEGAD